MASNVVFMHQTYPAQFGPVSEFLVNEHGLDVTFLSEFVSKPIHPKIKHIPYKRAVTGHEEEPYFFSRYFEQETSSMHGVFNAMAAARVKPDVLVGHVAFGNMGLLHVEYSNVPRIGFFELFYDPFGEKSQNRPEFPAPKPNRLRIPMRNATQLVELEYCTKGYSPTNFQRSTYPAAYQKKLSVIFDGVDTKLYCPGEPASTSALNKTWPHDVKLVTYVSRGLEAMRGFDIFMDVAHRICQRRTDVHFVIAGMPKTHYGSESIQLKNTSFKDYVLGLHPYDMNRFHFVEWLPEEALVDLYRLSDLHFYWTVPFTLSWSLFQALSTGCLVMASDVAAVRDAITCETNGALVDPQDRQAMVEKTLELLDAPARSQEWRKNARQTVEENFSFDVCLPRLAEFYLNN